MDRSTPVSTASRFRKCSVPAALALALTAGGCSGLQPPTAAELALACPKVAIVSDLRETTHLRAGGGRDMAAMISRAGLADFTGECQYDSTGVTVNVKLALLAEKGPALTGDSDSYQYFVAVIPPGEQIPTAKSVFDSVAKFTADSPRVSWVEEVTPRIPMPKGVNPREWNAKGWQVMIGFQLTPEELAFNRTPIQRGRR